MQRKNPALSASQIFAGADERSQEGSSVERCSWDSPVYYELLRRGIRWGIGQLGD